MFRIHFNCLSVKMVIKIKICEYLIDEWRITVVSLISLFLFRCLRMFYGAPYFLLFIGVLFLYCV
jgi:hypothetical protein